jgi:hypothetical protein
MLFSHLLSGTLKFTRLWLCTRSPNQEKVRLILSLLADARGKAQEIENAAAEEFQRDPREIPEFVKLVTDEENLPAVEDLDPSQFNCVVIDDFLGASTTARARFDQLFSRGRHLKNTSIWYLTQRWIDCPRSARINASHVCVYPPDSVPERRAIHQDCGGGLSFSEFSRVLTAVRELGAHHFLVCDLGAEGLMRFRVDWDRAVNFPKLISRTI